MNTTSGAYEIEGAIDPQYAISIILYAIVTTSLAECKFALYTTKVLQVLN